MNEKSFSRVIVERNAKIKALEKECLRLKKENDYFFTILLKSGLLMKREKPFRKSVRM